jgi:hypothetical protein
VIQWFTSRYGFEGKGCAFKILSLAYEHFEKKLVDVEETAPETKKTPLLTACSIAMMSGSKNDLKMIKYLVEVCGANVNAVDSRGQTVWVAGAR